jgi:tripartite-type tricarboxylate transporter receptor subunit TctC
MTRLITALILFAATFAPAQDKFPARNVNLILPYAAGGGVDLMGRASAHEAARLTGQSWVVSTATAAPVWSALRRSAAQLGRYVE